MMKYFDIKKNELKTICLLVQIKNFIFNISPRENA